jgi:hypothetical protein
MIPATPPQDLKVRDNITVMITQAYYPQQSHFWGGHVDKLAETPMQANFYARQLHFNNLIDATRKTKTFAVGWDGYDAPIPSDATINNGVEVLNKLKDTALSPYSVLPSAEGGIGISFRGKDGRRAMLEVLNDGSASYMIYGKGHPKLTGDFDAASPDLAPVLTLLTENF